MSKVKSPDIQFDMSEEDLEESSSEVVYGEDEYGEDYDDEDDQLSVTKPMDYHPLKLPQSQIDKMRAEYDVVVVQDFNDDYELSAEEMRERYQFYSVFERLRTMKVRYSELDAYVYAFREAMKCLRAVAKVNQVYPVDKFMNLVLSGEIKVSGLKFPKFNGSKGKKSINWERVIHYVADESLDPSDLLRKENEARFEVATEDDIRRISDQYFGGDIEGEISDMYADMETQQFVDPDSDDELDGKNVITPMSSKEEKHFIKIDKSALDGIRQFGVDRQSTGRQLKDFSFQITQRDFDEFSKIERIDESRGDDYLGIPVFTGDICNDDDVDRYIFALEEYELRHTTAEYNGKLMSMEEARELEIKDAMEQAGWNVRAMYNYAKDEKKEKKKLARMEKKREKMRKRLMKLEELTSGKNSVNGKKKKHNKKTKLKYDMNKGVEHALSSGYDSFASMQKAMERWEDD